MTNSHELNQWYWLKKELVEFAREHGLPTVGQKPELQRRIGHWLDTGEVQHARSQRKTSCFDWASETLKLDTVITDNYRNTRNVREFMKRHADAKFAFSNEFMAWMRQNQGQTLKEAVEYWRELEHKKREDGYREASLPQNQYAQFTRALSHAKPGISAADLRRIWKVKRSMPGPHVYKPGDENL